MISLSDVDGEMCVCHKYSDREKPQYRLNHFPTGIKTRDFIANYYPFDQCEISERGSSYEIRKIGGSYGCGLTLYLTDGNQTKSKKFETMDIPCPKVKSGINTRWNPWKGYWEKELKKGWCAV
jgi:hypothetical protein